ncbi:MAG: ribosomal protein S18 acetylase RimI-like enzyme [Planctomycetota bacterium]|jgi:ribosomal protein S18 acetylase RimI-like enzyme
MNTNITIREALPNEFSATGQLMIEVYSHLEGFPTRQEMPDYYEMLANVGSLTQQADTRLLVALSPDVELWGAVVYFGNMKDYASGGEDIDIDNASGIRLLAVDIKTRGMGVGRALTQACIEIAKASKHDQVVLHSTKLMKVAWAMYEKMGFKRSADLDFNLHGLSIFGFRLDIRQNDTQ